MKKFVVLAFCLCLCIAAPVLCQNDPGQGYENAIPMPIPEWHPPIGPPLPEERVVSYDIATDVETEWLLPVDGALEQDSVQGSAGLSFFWDDQGGLNDLPFEDPLGTTNFGPLYKVNNPQNYPLRVNCKIFITFPNGLTYVGSAVLIDDNFALTAGHCVHSQGDGGWATKIEVIPAYNNGSKPYGSALATNLYSWTGWTQSENFSHDMGLIRLDSAIGYSTGWYGYGYTNNLSFYSSYTFYNPGYPAAPPYDGRYMYYWKGTFDLPTTYILTFFSQAYGGQSGSGATVIFGGNYYVGAVLSHGTWFTTGDTRITSTKFGHIQDWIAGG